MRAIPVDATRAIQSCKAPSELKEENVMSSNRPFSRSVLPLSLKCILFSGWIFVLRNNNLLVTHLTDFRRSRMQEVVTTDLVKWPSLPQVSYSSVVHHPKYYSGGRSFDSEFFFSEYVYLSMLFTRQHHLLLESPSVNLPSFLRKSIKYRHPYPSSMQNIIIMDSIKTASPSTLGHWVPVFI